MNARDYKIFYEQGIFHVYNRGNNKGEIFFDEQDFVFLLERFKYLLGHSLRGGSRHVTPFPKEAFSVLAYCLMPNHYHFMIRQNTDIGIDRLMHKLWTGYVKNINVKYERVGGLFQDQFKAKRVDNDSYTTYLSAYIHKNHHRWREWKFSSIHHYLKASEDNFIDTALVLKMFNGNTKKYLDFISSFDNQDTERIKDILF